MTVLKKWLNKIRKVLDGHGYVCDGCGREIFHYPEKRLCADCEKKLTRINERACPKCGRQGISDGVCLTCKSRAPKFTRGFSPFVYCGKGASFINRVKNGNPRLALYFGEEMADCFARRYTGTKDTPILLVFVPMTESGMRARGYNQAERLAESVETRLRERGFSVETDGEILQKNRDTAQQKKMDASSRADNVAGAYRVHKRAACRGKTLLLVDDIMTTGATGSECARHLLAAGAKEVYFLTAVSLPEQK